VRLDPRGLLAGEQELPRGAVLAASPKTSDAELLGLFRIAFSMPAELASAQLRGATFITAGVLTVIALFASMVALLGAKQLATPIRALSRVASEVRGGNLAARVDERWGGELGKLARAFNSMVRSLDESTVSHSYVNRIIDSMPDALLVADANGFVQKTNHSAAEILGYTEKEIIGRPLAELFVDPALKEQLEAAMAGTDLLAGAETAAVGVGHPLDPAA